MFHVGAYTGAGTETDAWAHGAGNVWDGGGGGSGLGPYAHGHGMPGYPHAHQGREYLGVGPDLDVGVGPEGWYARGHGQAQGHEGHAHGYSESDVRSER
jgi:hypothetical protein